MAERHIDDFWAVWHSGKDWPELFASHSLAKNRAHSLARQRVGDTVFLLKLVSVGSAIYPAEPTLTGDLIKS